MKRTSSSQIKGMVDVSEKEPTRRVARAQASVQFNAETFRLLNEKGSPKGDLWETARVAGIMAAKATYSLIPMCHPLPLSKVGIEFQQDENERTVHVLSEVVCVGTTGVEMEALTAVSVAALTIYDMMKWAQKDIRVLNVQLNYKSGGKNGNFERKP